MFILPSKGVDTVASLDECAILGLRGDLCNCDCDNFGVVGVVVNGYVRL